MTIDRFFKKLYFLGIILLILACFLDWYSYRVIDRYGNVVGDWNYNIIFGWRSPLSDSPYHESFNEIFHPTFTLLPLSISIFLVIAIIISGYIVAFTDLEKITPQNNKKVYAYGVIALPVLLIYYIFSFPWILEDGYYPILIVTNSDHGLVYLYTMGVGNILAIISFPLIFTYSLFYFITIIRFEIQKVTPESMVQSLTDNAQEEVDLDHLIAVEEFKISKTPTRNQKN